MRGLMGMLVLGLSVGCASDTRTDDGPHPVWPPPPSPARIIHRMDFQQNRDFSEPGFFDGIGELLAGPQRQSMLRPNSVAVDDAGRVAVSDQELQGVHLFRRGEFQSRFIDRAAETFLVSPVGVALVGDRLVVADSALKQVFLFDLEGRLIRVLEKPGGFQRPSGVAVDPDRGELYVVDTLAAEVWVFDAGFEPVRHWGSPGQDIEQFNFPTHVHVDDFGRVLVTDSMNFRVQVFDRDGRYLFELGRHGDASGHFGVPKGIAVDSFGHIYVVDSYFSAVQIFDEEGRLLLSFGRPGEARGRFDVPTGIAIDGEDRIYVCDSQNGRVQVFQYIGGSDHASEE